MSTPYLTYCGNVHPATDLSAWFDVTARFAVPLARTRRMAGHEFGLGTWFHAATAGELAVKPAALDRLTRFLASTDLSIWTVNAFPYGDFHGKPVKTKVYEPDWSDEERLLYTRHVAEVVARVGSSARPAPSMRTVPISTLPLGYRDGRPASDLDDEGCRVMARNLVRAASHLQSMEEAHGVRLVLALEPEPFCLLETVAQAADFLERWVFREGGWTVAEDVLRRHLGVCVDLCHLAVLREDAIAALADLAARGIRCAKIQVSSCLELRDPRCLPELLAWDEPTYLHQTVAADGTRALDLADVAARREEFQAAGELRTHFHVPVFWDDDGALGSTQRELTRVLAALAKSPEDLPLLEVETYTWGVLPGWDKSDTALLSGLERELQFVDEALHEDLGVG